jgi:hypothetical protein
VINQRHLIHIPHPAFQFRIEMVVFSKFPRSFFAPVFFLVGLTDGAVSP